MKNLLQGLLFFSLFLFSPHLFAQKKYALIIGINKYYTQPNVLYRAQLRGCVNDAKAIKGLLINRFGFADNDDIILLTDANASRKIVDAAFQTLLLKAKPGDAFFFYFSGHGVWMGNKSQSIADKELKNGMNQAIVLSDMYSSNLQFLYRDIDLKRIFNKFVDKKVIATSVFDCCFSGHLLQAEAIDFHNPYFDLNPNLQEKSLPFKSILQDNNLSDTDLTHIFLHTTKDTLMDSVANTRAFNLGSELTISDPTFVVRPSERPKSMFLSFSGTDEYQKGEEMKDAEGNYHGVFTKAILQVYEDNNPDISLKKLFDNVSALIQKKGFQQTPSRFQDPNRLSKNLIGIDAINFKNNIEISIKSVKKDSIILNAGIESGIKTGNIFSKQNTTKKTELQVISIDAKTATAQVIQGNKNDITLNDRFVRINNLSKTNPLLKLYILSSPLSINVFNTKMNEIVIPLSLLKNYRNYEDWYLIEKNQYIFFNKTGFINSSLSRSLKSGENTNPFFIFLPVPSGIIQPFVDYLKLNQNYELVKDPDKANFVLYLNYTKDGYIFTWTKNIHSNNDELTFYRNHIKVNELPTNKKTIDSLTNHLISFTNQLAQQATGVWLNDNLRKK